MAGVPRRATNLGQVCIVNCPFVFSNAAKITNFKIINQLLRRVLLFDKVFLKLSFISIAYRNFRSLGVGANNVACLFSQRRVESLLASTLCNNRTG